MSGETLLSVVLVIKIAGTFFFAALPTLLASTKTIEKTLGIVPEPIVFVRLLGWAWIALLVGYLNGLQSLLRGEWPFATIRVGIVSNGGAALILASYLINDKGIDEKNENKKTLKNDYLLWVGVGFVSAVTFGLILSVVIQGEGF